MSIVRWSDDDKDEDKDDNYHRRILGITNGCDDDKDDDDGDGSNHSSIFCITNAA